MKDVNLETIIDTLAWYKIWRLNGFNLIRAKQKLLRKQKRAYQSASSGRGNQKSFTLTIPKNLAKLVKIFLETLYVNTVTVQKQMGLLRERYAGLKKGLLLYCCNQVWMKSGARIPWNVTAICETYKDLLSDRRFGEPFKGPISPFGSMVEYHPISAKDLSRLHQFGKKVLPGIFLVNVIIRGGESGKETFLSQTLRNWKRWTHLKSMPGDSMRRKC